MLACMLTGRGTFLHHHMVQVMRQHMQGPPTAVKNEMAALGLANPNWGGDYGGPVGFASSAWKHSAPTN